ncbi:sensor histidine kinase [Clostridium felsineum]|uniref:histidine kinase n=1 Tax=Clostridium felsineum TaxID=36839 RepID=A0A1S8MCC9_9CLOT|nr:PAS domain-containing sensor histidine kinase [Clostridium felsineum]MCR3759562.1 PAS domain-containing sensor histidine kinase [Clostridium felsineum]URZ05026.1 Sensor histidine kinase RcsC [Clostridium felsineum]URZ10067.1 Sensor histidine kinase RcsC [Clostridium felsineum]
MSYLFEEIYNYEEKIYVEISELFDKYNIGLQNRNKEIWLKCIREINKGIRDIKKETIDNFIVKLIKINQFYNRDSIFQILKCIENAYINYIIKNVDNANHIKETLSKVNDFFYNVEKTIIDNKIYYEQKIDMQIIDKILDSIPFLVMIKDENGKCIKVNKEAREFYGIENENDINDDVIINKILNSDNLKNFKIDTSSSKTFYEKAYNKDKDKKTLYVISVPILIKDDKFTITIKSDTTKFQKSDIANDSFNFKNIFKDIPEAVFIHDNKKILYLNKVAMELFGFERLEEAIGQNYNNFVEVCVGDIGSSKIGKPEYNIKRADIIRKSDNKLLKIAYIKGNYIYRSKEIELIVIWDMEYKTKIEELKNKMSEKNDVLNKVLYYSNAKTQFMGTISHELRTPLNIILSALQVIDLYANYGDLEEKCRVYEKYSVVMKQNGYRLLKMINNFMDITQIEDGASKLNFVQGNIVNIVEDVTLAVAAFLKDKGKNIIFDTDVEEKIMIFDKEKIERIILNLLSNAVKFTGKDASIKVRIHDIGSNIQISIKDNGIGIPEDKKKMIFERFFQLDKTFTRKNEGSGIGLSIVKVLVELHDGSIEVESNVGDGSEFIIKLPARKSNKYSKNYSDGLIRMSSKDKVNMEFSDLLI